MINNLSSKNFGSLETLCARQFVLRGFRQVQKSQACLLIPILNVTVMLGCDPIVLCQSNGRHCFCSHDLQECCSRLLKKKAKEESKMVFLAATVLLFFFAKARHPHLLPSSCLYPLSFCSNGCIFTSIWHSSIRGAQIAM